MLGAGRQAIVASCEILCIPARAGASGGRKCCRDWQGHCAPEWASPRWQGAPRTQTESLDPGEKGWLGMVLQASPSSTPTQHRSPLIRTPHWKPLGPEENTTRPLNSVAPFHYAHKKKGSYIHVRAREERRGTGSRVLRSHCVNRSGAACDFVGMKCKVTGFWSLIKVFDPAPLFNMHQNKAMQLACDAEDRLGTTTLCFCFTVLVLPSCHQTNTLIGMQ